MTLNFVKMSGAGNDFVLVDNRQRGIELSTARIVRLCDRHHGIGADGLILLVPCASGKADWAWQFYNSDGSPGEMCGNGARCFARFVQRLTGARDKLSFETGAGVITALFQSSRVTVNLTDPKDLRTGFDLPLSTGVEKANFVNTGVPHAVLFVPDVEKVMVRQLGAEIRRHPHFGPRGTNVNFAQVLARNSIRVRTFERGVEGETLACGTGVSAAALVSSQVHGFDSPVRVRVQSGAQLDVSFEKDGARLHNVQLSGPAEFVFEGTIEI